MRPITGRAVAPAQIDAPAGPLDWRPLDRSDATALYDLIATVEEADASPYRTSAGEVVEMLGVPWRDLAVDSIVGVDDGGVPRAYGIVEVRPGDSTVLRAVVQGGVDPVWRGQGIGRRLLAWLTDRGRQALAASEEDLPARIMAYVEDTAPTAEHHLFDRAGYVPLRFYASLRRDLAQPLPVAALGGGLRLVPWSEAMDLATLDAHNDAFRDHWGSQPQTPDTWLHGRTVFAPEWSFVVVDDEASAGTRGLDGPRARYGPDGPLVAGYVLSSRYEQDWPVAGYPSGYTETLGVRRAYRGRGIAVALLAAAMSAYRKGGMEYAHLDVDTQNPSGAHGLYASLGYERVNSSRLYAIEM